MEWTVSDKLTIASILPLKGSMFNMALCRDIKQKIQLSADDIKKSGLKTVGEGVVGTSDPEVKIDFTKDELTLLRESATKIKESEEVTQDNISIIEKLLK